MIINFKNVSLSGKGFIVKDQQEWVFDNFKLLSNQGEFHEVQHQEGEDITRIGWLAMNELDIVSDFTSHTKTGMQGRSVEDKTKYCLIYDQANRIQDIDADLIDVDTRESEILLAKYNWDNLEGNVHVDKQDLNALIILSLANSLLLVHSKDTDIRIAEGEIMVINRKDEKDNLTIVSEDHGILHAGPDKTIELGKGKFLTIDGNEFSPDKIVSEVSKTIGKVFENLNLNF